jgi:hypothetical protein
VAILIPREFRLLDSLVLKLIVLVNLSLVFHYTNEAGSLSPASTKEMHISTVIECSGPLRCTKY